jgi:hypothetical protein
MRNILSWPSLSKTNPQSQLLEYKPLLSSSFHDEPKDALPTPPSSPSLSTTASRFPHASHFLPSHPSIALAYLFTLNTPPKETLNSLASVNSLVEFDSALYKHFHQMFEQSSYGPRSAIFTPNQRLEDLASGDKSLAT